MDDGQYSGLEDNTPPFHIFKNMQLMQLKGAGAAQVVCRVYHVVAALRSGLPCGRVPDVRSAQFNRWPSGGATGAPGPR